MDKDAFAYSGSCFHAASVSPMDTKKGFKDSSKATRLADPGIAQPAILKTQLRFLKKAVFRSLVFLCELLLVTK